jgi:hypothetical protein
MPISKPTSVCPTSMRTADVAILSRASSKLYTSWVLVMVFVLIFFVCCWFIGRNVIAIYTAVTEWRSNVRATQIERSKGIYQDLTNAALDDEQYPSTRDHEDLKSENDLIRRKIAKLKKEYAAYNRALVKSGKKDAAEDAVDEKIIGSGHDNYREPLHEEGDEA